MSGKSAAGVLLSIKRQELQKQQHYMTEDEIDAFRVKLIKKYDEEAHPFYCGARLLNGTGF